MGDFAAGRRFPSRRDGWLTMVLGFAIVAELTGSVVFWLAPLPIALRLAVTAGMLGVCALVLSTLLATHYTVEAELLRVRSGPFRWTIPLAEIRHVTPTSNPLSSPALSLDRLEIAYGKRRLMVSPEDKQGFLDALAARVPGLEVHGDRATRR